MRPKSEIYTTKRDDEHPRLFNMGVPPPPPPPFFFGGPPPPPPRESKHIPLVRAQLKKCVAHFQTNGIYHFVGTGIFLEPKTGTGLNFAIYKIPVNFSLSLDLTPGTGNPNKWYRKFRSFRWQREKGITSKGITFFRKMSTRVNRSLWILPGISRFSIQMVSAQGFINTIDDPMSWICIWGTTDCTTVLHLSVEKLVSLPVLLNTGLFKIIFL